MKYNIPSRVGVVTSKEFWQLVSSAIEYGAHTNGVTSQTARTAAARAEISEFRTILIDSPDYKIRNALILCAIWRGWAADGVYIPNVDFDEASA